MLERTDFYCLWKPPRFDVHFLSICHFSYICTKSCGRQIYVIGKALEAVHVQISRNHDITWEKKMKVAMGIKATGLKMSRLFWLIQGVQCHSMWKQETEESMSRWWDLRMTWQVIAGFEDREKLRNCECSLQTEKTP